MKIDTVTRYDEWSIKDCERNVWLCIVMQYAQM